MECLVAVLRRVACSWEEREASLVLNVYVSAVSYEVFSSLHKYTYFFFLSSSLSAESSSRSLKSTESLRKAGSFTREAMGPRDKR